MAYKSIAASDPWSSGSRQVQRDVNKRQRYDAHERAGAMSNLGGRNAEFTLAREKNPNMSDAELGMWHTYVHKGGSRPGGSGGGGGWDGGGGAPTMGADPTLNLPEYDEDKVSALTQKRAAPGVRRLRETTRSAMNETYDNPNVKKMTVRDALSGYGTGLENVISGAGQAATQEYGQQYAASVNAEMARYQGALAKQSQEYSTQSQSYLMSQQQAYWEQQQDYNSDPYAAFDEFYS